jgi:hypothetical protein
LTRRSWILAFLAGWLGYLVADFWTHAVLLAAWWRATEAYWLPPLELFHRIPFAYVSFGIYTFGALWLTVRVLGLRPALGRTIGFGALLGLVMGAVAGLANYSVFPMPWTSLLVWPGSMAIAIILQNTLFPTTARGDSGIAGSPHAAHAVPVDQDRATMHS